MQEGMVGAMEGSRKRRLNGYQYFVKPLETFGARGTKQQAVAGSHGKERVNLWRE